MHLLKIPYVILDCFAYEMQIFNFLKKEKKEQLVVCWRLTFTGVIRIRGAKLRFDI